MGVAKQIKIFSNFKKQSSKDSKTKNSIINIANEYERIGEQKNPDINHNLTSENIILKSFDIKEYEKIIENTDYNLNSKNSKYEDIYSTTPTIQATNFVNLGGINLTFLMEKDEWVEYYKDLSNFVKDYMGDSFIPLSEVIQFDEFTPHLQVMGIFRSEVSNESLADKNLLEDSKLFEEISRKQFTRHNNKLKGTDDYVDPKNKKEYKEAKIKWIEENKGNIIKNYKPRNKTTEKKYAYIRNDNPLATKKNSYADYQNKLYEFNKEHKFIKKLCEKATEIRGEKVSFVRNTTEPVYDGKSKNHYEIKETIERENKEIESKIQKGIDLTENEVYRYIRKQNRDKLKKEFLEFDINSWRDKFKEPQKAQYDFNLKLSNDYIKIAKEIAYKPYMELQNEMNNLEIEKVQTKKELEDIKKEAYDFYKYTDKKLIKESKKILENIEPQKNILGKFTGKYILTEEQKENISNIIQTRLNTNDNLIKANNNYTAKKDKEVKDLLKNVSNELNYYSKKVFGLSFNIDLNSKSEDNIYNVLNSYAVSYEYDEKKRLYREKSEFEKEKKDILFENRNIKNNLEALSNIKAKELAKIKLEEYKETWKKEESGKVREELLSEIKLTDEEIKIQRENLIKGISLSEFEIREKKVELLKEVKITDKDIQARKENLKNNVKLTNDEIYFIKDKLYSQITLMQSDIKEYKEKLLEKVKDEYINEIKSKNKEILKISKKINIVDETYNQIKNTEELLKIKEQSEELLIDNFVDTIDTISDIAEIKDNEEIYYELTDKSQEIVDYSANIEEKTRNMEYIDELKEFARKNFRIVNYVVSNIAKVVIEINEIAKDLAKKISHSRGFSR